MTNTATDITRPNPHPVPGCYNCGGTGWDDVFGNACDCESWTARTTYQARFARQGQPVEQHHAHGDGTGHGHVSNGATDKQVGYIRSLVEQHTAAHPWVAEVTAKVEAGISRQQASAIIDSLVALKSVPVPTTPAPSTPVRTNRFDGTCRNCGGNVPAGTGALTGKPGAWVTTHIECPTVTTTSGPVEGIDLSVLKPFTSRNVVRVAVPGGDTRLKLRVEFAKNGVTYVNDAAEYGQRTYYGQQRPGEAYRGKAADALAIIVADPAAAIIAYTALTGSCGVCGRHLEDATSVAAGIGPVCREKLGITLAPADDPDACRGGVCSDVDHLCSRHQAAYQRRHGRASNE